MFNLKKTANKMRLPENEQGQGMVEYALILSLVAVVAIAVLLQLGPTVSGVYCKVTNALQSGSCVAGIVKGPWTWGGPAVDGCAELGLTGTGKSQYIWSNNPSLSNPGSVFWVSTGPDVKPQPTAQYPNIHYISSATCS